MRKAIRQDKPWQAVFRVVRGSGKIVWIQATARPSREINGKVLWNGVLMDITRQKETEGRLEYMALHDPLTGLGNRTFFMERLSQALSQASRYNHLVGLVYLDLNGFKEVNDSLGHQAGDQVLVEAATRIWQSLRKSDVPCRMGGDEFSILLPEMKDQAEAYNVARKILDNMSGVLHLNPETTVSLSASIGISIFPDHAEDKDRLIYEADQAMYRAKISGGRMLIKTAGTEKDH